MCVSKMPKRRETMTGNIANEAIQTIYHLTIEEFCNQAGIDMSAPTAVFTPDARKLEDAMRYVRGQGELVAKTVINKGSKENIGYLSNSVDHVLNEGTFSRQHDAAGIMPFDLTAVSDHPVFKNGIQAHKFIGAARQSFYFGAMCELVYANTPDIGAYKDDSGHTPV